MSVPILCYHQVGPEAMFGRRLNIDPELLAAHIRFFIRRGRQFICARELASAWPNSAVCLTFDDAFHSTLTYGLDVMRSLGVRGSIYAVPDCVGDVSRWDVGHEAPLATWEQLRAAQAEGYEIGNHTMHHARLGDLKRQDQVQEWTQAQAELTQRGIISVSACLPYGSRNEHTPDAITDSGLTLGLALGWRAAQSSDSRLLLPRIVVAFSDRLPLLLYRMYVRPLFRPSARKIPSGDPRACYVD